MIVDDRASARKLLERLVQSLDPGLSVKTFGRPEEAAAWAEVAPPDLVIADYRMPGMNGVVLTQHLRRLPDLADVPIVIVTVVEDREIRYQALEAGATDFLTRPIDPIECRSRCRNLLALRRSQRVVAERARWLEERFTQASAQVVLREEETLLRLARAGEFRDEDTGNHILRMSKYARLIAEAMGYPCEEVNLIEKGAMMHDIGKVGITDGILRKPGTYTEGERTIMREHTQIGYRILADSPSRFLQIGAVIALGHHEKFDGTGYPDGLAGERIPMECRIAAVADVFDALTSARPYKDAWPMERAVRLIQTEIGGHFDPECAEAFLSRLAEVRDIRRDFADGEPT